MPSSQLPHGQPPAAARLAVKEEHIEHGFIGTLQSLKYDYRADIRDRATLEKNFREKFEALNRVKLTESEFSRLLDEIVTPDVYAAAKTLRSINAFTILKEYPTQGFVMDDGRLKNPDGRPDCFDEMLARIRDIRASEKRIHQKMRDLFALSSDDDKTDMATLKRRPRP